MAQGGGINLKPLEINETAIMQKALFAGLNATHQSTISKWAINLIFWLST